MASRVGLSRFQRPAPLLSRVKGKQREKLARQVDDDALPISSAEEDNGDNSDSNPSKPSGTSGLIRPLLAEVSDESGPDERFKGSIKRTTFGTSTANRSRRQGTRNRNYSAARDEIAAGFDEITPSSNKRRKLQSDDSDTRASVSDRVTAPKSPSPSNPHTDVNGFVTVKKSRGTYGNRKKNGSSQGSQADKDKQTASSKGAIFRPVDKFDSPQKPRRARLSAPQDTIPSSPSKEQRPSFKRVLDEDDEDTNFLSSSKPRKPTITRIDSSQGSQSSLKSKKPGNVWKGQSRLLKKLEKAAAENPPKPKRAKFKMPAEIPDFDEEARADAGSADSPLSDLRSLSDTAPDETPASDASDAEDERGDGSMTECPWCGDRVETALLKEFSKGKRLNVRMQSRFCQKHKKETAMDTWRSRHYPTVQWANLEDRFAEHREFLLGVVDGESSYFRNALAEKIESGTAARSLKKEDNLNPGYYGPRGFNLMCDYLVREFGDLLKEAAVSDRVIAGRGTPAFIQSVLVAELAVRLIQEDMDVSVKDAREIMEESKVIGEMVHEEV